jgi:hypothetical protein
LYGEDRKLELSGFLKFVDLSESRIDAIAAAEAEREQQQGEGGGKSRASRLGWKGGRLGHGEVAFEICGPFRRRVPKIEVNGFRSS